MTPHPPPEALPSLDAAWRGIMINYEEQDFPGSEPYMRSIPGWECVACGKRYGTSGLPPNPCACGNYWDREVCK